MKNESAKVLMFTVVGLLFLALGASRLAADVVITATPVVSSGTNGICPGGYIGYVNYTKTVANGWGWAPTGTGHSVTDTNRTDTKVEFQGKSGDTGCNQTTVSIPDPTSSTKYRFHVYFTNNVPTNAYSLVLAGFNP
jgi:hypothetical protein